MKNFALSEVSEGNAVEVVAMIGRFDPLNLVLMDRNYDSHQTRKTSSH